MNKDKIQHHPINNQLQYDYILGPIKIKDGLFIGDELAAKDVEFIISNKVTHIINTVSKRIPNIWEKIGVQYLSFNWTQAETNIFDKKNITLNTLYNFIEQAMELGQSCLVHSINAKSRSCVIVAAYLMKKYAWSLEKSLQFIGSKKQQLDIRQGFFYQLKELEERLNKIYNFSNTWEDIKNEDDLILRNTYINSKKIDYKQTQNPNKSKKKVTWTDAEGKNPKQKKKLLINEFQTNQIKQNKQKQFKSILKGSIKTSDQNILKPQDPLVEPKIINNINGNIIHLTVNNFLSQEGANTTTQNSKKVPSSTNTNLLMTRPHSSDAKDRQKKKDPIKEKKIVYDTLFGNFKQSPYQTKFVNNTKLGYQRTIKSATTGVKKQQPIVTINPQKNLTVQDRPQSASYAEKKKGKGSQTLKQQLIVTNGNKKVFSTGRYPSPMVKQQAITLKNVRDKWKGL